MRSKLWCSVIFLYCLLVGVYTFELAQLTTSSQPVAAATPQVLAASDVRFPALPEAPDTNQVFELVNQARVAHGNKSLVANERLGQLAAARAADMAAKQYYSHLSPDDKYYYDYLSEYGVKTNYSCENLDLVFVLDNTAVINDWLNSTKGHHECMLGDNLVEAGYATTPITLLDYAGQPTHAYVVVAIHTSALK